MKSLKFISAVVSLSIIFSLGGCEDKMPRVGSEQYNQLHGILNDGNTVNEITLFSEQSKFQPKLRFPPTVRVAATTWESGDGQSAKIRKGFANEVVTSLWLSEQGRLLFEKVDASSDGPRRVSFAFIAGVDPNFKNSQKQRLKDIVARSVRTTDLPELGLKEYVVLEPKSSAIATVAYVPLRKEDLSLFGDAQWISCEVAASTKDLNEPLIGRVDSCATSFHSLETLTFTASFERTVLSSWRDLVDESNSFANSILMK
ncbi:hypothetical protein RY831_03910 [Noviherbaspirillum sp. CPCC 100848]|uniref:Lipoprotein n=1 Tax=Noviherbaspirillum album TaxID=3080276 RepID=A0ABU6J3T4_9BURK|nr:hypothetical protein [Noviherbaspirillum sp. CPCC 100848]MEC4718280.1 hypothetical protein [Noviherbaspirillum sp. CPCC 100848]